MVNEIIFNSGDVENVMAGFASHFKTRVISDKAGYSLNLPAAAGEGSVSMFDFRNGITMLSFSCSLKKDLALHYIYNQAPPLRLLFCLQNELRHIIRGDCIQYQLTDLLGSMVSGSAGKDQVFLLSGEKQIDFYAIEIDRKRYREHAGDSIDTLPPELRQVFSDTAASQAFLYQGNYSLTIAQCIQDIRTASYEGLVKRIFTESKTLEILALQIKQFTDDMAPSRKQSVLRRRDMELIIEARNRLVADLIKPPTIKELAQLTGTNENKLKKGFRLLYNTSINKLLQNERLSKAKLLIAEESYPIREIARMVGYRHSGHFTSKFKKKFGVLPREYLKAMVG